VEEGAVARPVRIVVWAVVVVLAVVVLFTWVFPWVESWQQDPTLGVGVEPTRVGAVR
jgi:hypothetical protein